MNGFNGIKSTTLGYNRDIKSTCYEDMLDMKFQWLIAAKSGTNGKTLEYLGCHEILIWNLPAIVEYYGILPNIKGYNRILMGSIMRYLKYQWE